jgi:hypothetical protein
MIAEEGGTGAARKGTTATPWNPQTGADLADLHVLTGEGNEAAKERPAFSERKFQQNGYSIVSIPGKTWGWAWIFAYGAYEEVNRGG